jgi:hypothetical protein
MDRISRRDAKRNAESAEKDNQWTGFHAETQRGTQRAQRRIMKSSCCFSLRSLRSSSRLCVKRLVILRLCVKRLVILRLCVKPLVILNPFFHGLSDQGLGP